MAAEIILHHYPQSPVSEKVRVAFGIKGLAWRSVIIPRLPPKPDVIALTGGYRRTPIMQIGADVYCDSLCILRNLDRLYPVPGFFPDGTARWALAAWSDGDFFRQAIAVVLGSEVGNLPPDFAADRGRLYFGPNYDLQGLAAELPHRVGQLRAHLDTMWQLLCGDYMHGRQPGLLDALCYYLAWFLRGRYKHGPELLAGYPDLVAWERRVRAIGHGPSSDMASSQSLDVALAAHSTAEPGVDRSDPLGLSIGALVEIAPEGDGGDPPVKGELVYLGSEEVALRRTHPSVGAVVVHFPRLGYRVVPLDPDGANSLSRRTSG